MDRYGVKMDESGLSIAPGIDKDPHILDVFGHRNPRDSSPSGADQDNSCHLLITTSYDLH